MPPFWWHTVETLSPSLSLTTISRYGPQYVHLAGIYKMEYFFDKLASYRARAFALRTFFSQLLRRHYGSGRATAPGAERTFFAALVARFAGLEHLFADDGDGDGSDGGRPEFDELCVLDARGTPTCRSCLANINSDATIIADEHFARLPEAMRETLFVEYVEQLTAEVVGADRALRFWRRCFGNQPHFLTKAGAPEHELWERVGASDHVNHR